MDRRGWRNEELLSVCQLGILQESSSEVLCSEEALGGIPKKERTTRYSKDTIKHKTRRESAEMIYKKITIFFILFTVILASVEGQKLVLDIKSEKQLKKLTKFKDEKTYCHLDWTPDGEFIIYARDGEIRKLQIRKGKDQRLTIYSGTVVNLKVSPSGKKIAYYIWGPFLENKIIIQDLQQQEERIEVPWRGGISFTWNSDEKKLIGCAGWIYGGEEIGFPSFIDIKDRKVERIKELPYYCSSIASNYKAGIFGIFGHRIKKIEKGDHFYFFKEGQKIPIKKILLKDIKDACIEDIDCKGENVLISAKLSEPKKYNLQDSRQLFIYNLKKDILYLITKEKESTYISDARFSPDCKKIAFFSNRDGAYNIWLLDLEEKK